MASLFDDEPLADFEVTLDALQGVWRHSWGMQVTVRGTQVRLDNGESERARAGSKRLAEQMAARSLLARVEGLG